MPERRRSARLAGRTGAALVVLGLALGGAAAGAAGPAPVRDQVGGDAQLPVDPTFDPDETRERADEILQGDEYQAPQARDRNVIERLREWIGDRLPDFDLDLGGAGDGGGELVSYLVVGVVVVGALAALTYVLVQARGTRRPASDGDPDADVDVTPLRTADEWATEAERCEREGDHRGAVRARFRSLTTALARRDLVADTPGRTAGELRADVAERAPGLTPAFAAVADLFERAWFGGGTAGPTESAAARDLAGAALDAAPRHRRDTDAAADGVGAP
ncbi:DUF4129 domain-containing protein [Iamia sp. SCSIO 61187]|uniref:DUF4129 domain-containing protein n=1 Tax=Iamia sp. SCSIO 61187 TaxID=2722752 RepID=UPI001C638DA6|nr:DUF4129 domain-containing protein [Iamia sp. SCSIO 61187]QYG92534.1 DUF4129 domain-containing protein [Iamia sp. SCSIO 61187]